MSSNSTEISIATLLPSIEHTKKNLFRCFLFLDKERTIKWFLAILKFPSNNRRERKFGIYDRKFSQTFRRKSLRKFAATGRIWFSVLPANTKGFAIEKERPERCRNDRTSCVSVKAATRMHVRLKNDASIEKCVCIVLSVPSECRRVVVYCCCYRTIRVALVLTPMSRKSYLTLPRSCRTLPKVGWSSNRENDPREIPCTKLLLAGQRSYRLFRWK